MYYIGSLKSLKMRIVMESALYRDVEKIKYVHRRPRAHNNYLLTMVMLLKLC